MKVKPTVTFLLSNNRFSTKLHIKPGSTKVFYEYNMVLVHIIMTYSVFVNRSFGFFSMPYPTLMNNVILKKKTWFAVTKSMI